MDSATFCDLVGIPALSKRADSITVQTQLDQTICLCNNEPITSSSWPCYQV